MVVAWDIFIVPDETLSWQGLLQYFQRIGQCVTVHRGSEDSYAGVLDRLGASQS